MIVRGFIKQGIRVSIEKEGEEYKVSIVELNGTRKVSKRGFDLETAIAKYNRLLKEVIL